MKAKMTNKVYLENTSNKKAIGIALEEVQADKIIIKD